MWEAERSYNELYAWRAQNLDVIFKATGHRVTPHQPELMSKLLEELNEATDERVKAPLRDQLGEAMCQKAGDLLGQKETVESRYLRRLPRQKENVVPRAVVQLDNEVMTASADMVILYEVRRS